MYFKMLIEQYEKIKSTFHSSATKNSEIPYLLVFSEIEILEIFRKSRSRSRKSRIFISRIDLDMLNLDLDLESRLS